MQHTNVVRIIEHGLVAREGAYWIVSEWVGPATLAARVSADPPPPAQTITDWFVQLADGLATVHVRAGRLHGDL